MLHYFTLHCTRSVHAASACSKQWSGACTFFTTEARRAAPFLTANTPSPCASRDIPHYDPEQEREGPYNNSSSACPCTTSFSPSQQLSLTAHTWHHYLQVDMPR